MKQSNNNKTNKNNDQQFDPYTPHKIQWWGWPLLALLILGTIYICRTEGPTRQTHNSTQAAPWQADTHQKAQGSIFGTIYHITYNSHDDLSKGIEQTLNNVDNSLSPFNNHSTITHINDGTSMNIDTMFNTVFTLAKQVSQQTNGAFDITVAPLVNLWGFGFKTGETVTDAAVDSIRQYVGFQMVDIVDGKVVKQKPEVMLDCSAIAKGFGVDAVGNFLEANGVTNYMVEIGGEVRLRGHNPKGTDWSIGVTTPTDDSLCLQNDVKQIIMTTNRSMATSGNYRNFYIKEGKKFAHTIDPRTGHPVQHNILSSTVLATDCAVADAYATAFMVLGLEEAQKVLAKHNELDAYFIIADDNGEMKEWCTDRMKSLLQKN